jgi:choline-sulfatase
MCSFVDFQIGCVLTVLRELGLEEKTRIIYSSDHGESLGARGMFGKFTMYEESAAVPLIIAGPDVPSGKVVDTPVSLVDCFPTIIEGLGCNMPTEYLPGSSLWKIAGQPDTDRTVFSEYHAIGSRHATYMMRDMRYKYICYVHAPSQLFDLQVDPHELRDLAALPEYDSILKDFEARLRALLDPETDDAQALSDQAALVQLRGGREQVIARGSFANSPVPGEKPIFFRPSAT